jgi:GNAT superfamily N-acetyltransferase
LPDGADPPALKLEPAQPGDLPALNRLAIASKRHWKYPDEWIEAWREDLTLTQAQLESWTVLVARDSAIRAFGAVDLTSQPAVIEHLWVDPESIRLGLGTHLFLALRAAAVAAGHQTLCTDSDPNALKFYLALGGVHTENISSPVLGNPRKLPRIEFDLGL